MNEYDAVVIDVDVLPTTAGMVVNYYTLVQAQHLVRDHNGDIEYDDGIEEQHNSARTSLQQTTDHENQKEINRNKVFESIIKIAKKRL